MSPQSVYVTYIYSDLSFHHDISNVCRTSYHHIRQLHHIRSSLDHNSAVLHANSLVSKLDYCNSLFYNLPDNSLKRLQHVQNSLARFVVPSIKRHQHIHLLLLIYTGYLLNREFPSELLPSHSRLLKTLSLSIFLLWCTSHLEFFTSFS